MECKIIENVNKKAIAIDMFNRNFIFLNKSNKDDLSQLENNKKLFNNYDEYINYVRKINHLSTVYYNITYRCNLNCSYCYAEHNSTYVPLEQNKVILNNLKSLNAKSISLIGGEPLCHPNFEELFQEILNIKEIEEIFVITNGTLINENHIKLFSDKRVIIQVSLDGFNEATNSLSRTPGSFTKAFNNLLKLKQSGINLRVMQTITSKNIKHSFDFYKFFKSNNISAGYFMVKKVEKDLKPTLNQLETLMDLIYEEENKNIDAVFSAVKFADNMFFSSTGYPITHCGAGINAISVGTDGTIYPCVKRMYEHNKLGTLMTLEGVNEFKNNRLNIINSDLVVNKPSCSNCDLKFFCGGGCRAENNYVNKEIDDYNCKYYKFAYNYFFNKLLTK